MEEKPKAKSKVKNPYISTVISLAIAVYLLCKGSKLIAIGYEMKSGGIFITICGVVLVILAIIDFCRRLKRRIEENES